MSVFIKEISYLHHDLMVPSIQFAEDICNFSTSASGLRQSIFCTLHYCKANCKYFLQNGLKLMYWQVPRIDPSVGFTWVVLWNVTLFKTYSQHPRLDHQLIASAILRIFDALIQYRPNSLITQMQTRRKSASTNWLCFSYSQGQDATGPMFQKG